MGNYMRKFLGKIVEGMVWYYYDAKIKPPIDGGVRFYGKKTV